MTYRRAPITLILCLLSASLISACGDANVGPPPKPVELTRDATAYFCNMIVVDHPGPKSQIHLAGRAEPIFFPSVVDAIAFLMLPGESKNVRAVYVNDMGRTDNWKSPDPGTWTDAYKAFFVLDSERQSGMGQKEAVPFGTKQDAEEFVREHGGHIARLEEVPATYIFPGADPDDPPNERTPNAAAVRTEASR